MIKLLKNIFDRATGIKTETTSLANTAARVGGVLEDLVRLGAQPFDDTASYKGGQFIIYQGVLTSVELDTSPGETPDTHSLKFSRKVVLDPAGITEGNNLPVGASALRALIDSGELGGGSTPPNADENTRGLAKQASDPIYQAGISNDTYVTPKQARGDFNTLAETISNLDIPDDLQKITDGGFVTTDPILAEGGFGMDAFQSTASPLNVSVIISKSIVVDGVSVVKQVIASISPEAFVNWLKPYLNTTTPDAAPTVLNPIPDQTITATGDQSYQVPSNTFSGNNLTYSATKADGSALPITFNASNRTFTIPGQLANQVINVRVTASNTAGQISDVFVLTISRTTNDVPYIQRIRRKYIAGLKTVYYLLDSSYEGTDLSKLPVYRCKRADESSWRSDWGSTISTSGVFTDFAEGFLQYCYGNLANEGETSTTTIFQFKPYPGAPDASIIERTYTQGTANDAGTIVYTAGSGRIQAIRVERIAGPEKYLSVYVVGSGVITSKLEANPGTPAYSGGTKIMATEGAPWGHADLFTGGHVTHGSLYAGVVNGSYLLTIVDENGVAIPYTIAVTDTTPSVTLLTPSDTGGGGTGGGDSSAATVSSSDGANLAILDVSVQWNGATPNRARLYHNNKPTSGTFFYIWSGQEMPDLPTAYELEPGDEVVLDFIKNQTGTTYFFEFPVDASTKAQKIFRIGQPS